jgi:hypothetical protein
MDPKLKGFFDTAQQTAEATSAAEAAAQNAEARRTAALAQSQQALKEMVEAEFGPIVEVLKSLPDKDSKRFTVRMSDSTWGSTTTTAEYNIAIRYDTSSDPGRLRHHYDDYDSARREPYVSVDIRREADGALRFSVTQGSLLESSHSGPYHNKHSRPADVEAVRQELALGLGTFAADRMAEIGAALGAVQATASDASAPGDTEDPAKIGVMKPLHFRGAFGAMAAPQEKTAPVGGTAADDAKDAPATAPAAKKRNFWNRLWA